MIASVLVRVERAAWRGLTVFATRFGSGRRRPSHLRIGRRGEDEALFFLRAQGFTVVARRWRCTEARGDLDLVAWERGPHKQRTLCFVEVKTRTARDLSPAESAVDRGKERSLRDTAAAYLRRMPRADRETADVRFDVVSVYLLPAGVQCELLRDAFGLRPDLRPGFSPARRTQ